MLRVFLRLAGRRLGLRSRGSRGLGLLRRGRVLGVRHDDGFSGCLVERRGHFVRFALAWLDGEADTLEREEKLYALTRICTRSGESWVACGPHSRIVGFALVELAEHGRHYAEHEILELHYAGVAPEHRRQGVFAALIRHIQARMLPITASINHQNRADAVRQFEKYGFRDSGAAGGERGVRWQPGAAA